MEVGVAVDAPSEYLGALASTGTPVSRTLVVIGKVASSAVTIAGSDTAPAGGVTEAAALAAQGWGIIGPVKV